MNLTGTILKGEKHYKLHKRITKPETLGIQQHTKLNQIFSSTHMPGLNDNVLGINEEPIIRQYHHRIR